MLSRNEPWALQLGEHVLLAPGKWLWLRSLIWAAVLFAGAILFFFSLLMLGQWLHLPERSDYAIALDGNSFTDTPTAWVDTANRTILKPVASADVSGCASMPAGASAADNSLSLYQPGISKPFIICYAPIAAHTRFWDENGGQDVLRQGCADNSCPSQYWFEWNGSLGDAMQSPRC